jgi:hypothetical protein
MIGETIVKVIIVLVILYLGYQLILRYTPFGDKADEAYDNYTPADAYVPENIPSLAVEGERTIVPGGPSAPSQAAPLDSALVVPPPAAVDPYAEPNEGANAPEHLRHPERMFRPAPAMENNMIQDAGIGAMASHVTSDAAQTFAPEFAQNGGEFMMGGVFANDVDVPTNYSAF